MPIAFSVRDMLEDEPAQRASSPSRKAPKEDPWESMAQDITKRLSEVADLGKRCMENPQVSTKREYFAAVASTNEEVDFMRYSFETAMSHPESYHMTTDVMMGRSESLRNWEREVTDAQKAVEAIKAADKKASQQQRQTDGAQQETNEFMQREMQIQRDITEVDDQTLDRLHGGIQRVKVNAQLIHEELDVQEHIIEEVDTGMSRVQSRLESVIKKVGTLLDATSDRGKIIVIVVLMVILLVLVGLIM